MSLVLVLRRLMSMVLSREFSVSFRVIRVLVSICGLKLLRNILFFIVCCCWLR